MTTETFDLASLEIIGYASTVETPTLPRVLAPVFRVLDAPDLILFPPYSLQATEVLRAHLGNRAEFEEFIAKEKITPLDPPCQAKVQHDLWVSPEGSVTYAPKAEVKKAFANLYEKHLNLAEAKLAEKDFEAAARHAAVARSVDPGKLDPLIIRGVTEFALADTSYYEFTRELAEKIVKAAEFDLLVRGRMQGDNRVAVPEGRQGVPEQSVQVHLQNRVEGDCIISITVQGRGAQVMDGAINRRTRYRIPTAVHPTTFSPVTAGFR
jgi:hypothetical protein